MGDIFSITYEEALENGIIGNLSKYTFDNIVDGLRFFVRQGEFFYYSSIKTGLCVIFRYYRDEFIDYYNSNKDFEKHTIFKVDDFNNISKEQFYKLRGVYRNFGIKKILFIIKLQAYLKGEIEGNSDKEIELNQTIKKLTEKINHLKELNNDLKQKNTLLNKQLNQYDREIQMIERFKEETQRFLDKI